MNKKAFTLIEIMISILIVSIVIVGGFQALSSVTIGKSRIIQKVETQKQILYFSEKLFEMIKAGGTIDYEEYFNRQVVGLGLSQSGHYLKPSGFGNYGYGSSFSPNNYGVGYYRCLSGNGISMGTGGCVENFNTPSFIYSGSTQRYGQYSLQFIDHNSNLDGDVGDENGDGSIIGDYDDSYIGLGPVAFQENTNLHELYLINGNIRTYFRFNKKQDPNAPAGKLCNNTSDEGCIGTIEFLELKGYDYGLDHSAGTNDSYENDGVVDTWVVSDKITGNGTSLMPGDGNDYWVKLFDENVNISDFKIFLYPNTIPSLSWKDKSESSNISPYLKIQYKISPSWKLKNVLKNNVKPQTISTTINLPKN